MMKYTPTPPPPTPPLSPLHEGCFLEYVSGQQPTIWCFLRHKLQQVLGYQMANRC